MQSGERREVTANHRTIPNGGHRFGPDLTCGATGCHQGWDEQQLKATQCCGTLSNAAPKTTRIGKTTSRLGYLCQLYGVWQRCIAERSGVGVSAVSNVLRGRGGVSPMATGRVEASALSLLAERGVEFVEFE